MFASARLVRTSVPSRSLIAMPTEDEEKTSSNRASLSSSARSAFSRALDQRERQAFLLVELAAAACPR